MQIRRLNRRTVTNQTHQWDVREVSRRQVSWNGAVPLSVSPCGRVLVTSHMSEVYGFRLPDLSLEWSLSTSERVYPSANPYFSAQGEMLLGLGHTVTWFSLPPAGSPARLRSILVAAQITNCSLSPDGARLAVYDNTASQLTLHDVRPSLLPSWVPVPVPSRPLYRAAGGFHYCVPAPSSQFWVHEEKSSGDLIVIDPQGNRLAQRTPLSQAASLYACHRSVLFTPAETLLYGSYQGIELIDWRAATSVLLVAGEHRVGGLALSPDGAVLASCDRAGLTLYGLGPGDELPMLWEGPLQAFAMEFLPDSRRLAVGTEAGQIVLLELVTATKDAPPPGPAWRKSGSHNWRREEVVWERFDSDSVDPRFKESRFTPDIAMAAPGEGRLVALADGWRQARMARIGDDSPVQTFLVPAEGDQMQFDSLTLACSRLAVGRRKSLMVWDLDSGRLWHQEGNSHYYGDRIHALSFSSPDRLWYAGSDGLGCVDLADPTAWRWISGRRRLGPGTVDGACLQVDSALLVRGRELTFCDLGSPGRVRWTRKLPWNKAQLALSPEGKLAAVCCEGEVEVLAGSDAALVRKRKVMELEKSLRALGFVSESLLLLQFEERFLLLDVEKDRLFYPPLTGRLLSCWRGGALTVDGDRVDFWQLG